MPLSRFWSFSLSGLSCGAETVTVTLYFFSVPFCAFTVYVTGREKSCAAPISGVMVANSDIVMLGANVVFEPAGRVIVTVPLS